MYFMEGAKTLDITIDGNVKVYCFLSEAKISLNAYEIQLQNQPPYEYGVVKENPATTDNTSQLDKVSMKAR